jgi:3-dehydroquinate synthase
VIASRLSERVCGLLPADSGRVRELIAAAGLPTVPPTLSLERWLDLMGRDKKVTAGTIRFVLLEALGRAAIRADVPPDQIEAALAG